MGQTLTTRTDSDKTAERFAFGVYDDKDREIGAWATTATATFAASDSNYGYMFAPGVRFAGRVQMTRGGACYGASQLDRFFDTAAERDAWIAGAIVSGRKRAVAKYAVAAKEV